MPNNYKGELPLYLQVKTTLKERIEAETYKDGELLPSELELQKMFNVSRITIRQAMSELSNEGYIFRIRGKGTFVKFNKINENLNNIISFTNEMQMKGLNAFTKSVVISIAKADKAIEKALKVEKNSFVYKIERIRGANNTPFVVFISYFSLHRNLPLDKELYMGSLYELLEKSCGATPTKAIDHFEAVAAEKDICAKLDVEAGSPILKRTRQSFDSAGDVLEYTICYYRADKYKYSIIY